MAVLIVTAMGVVSANESLKSYNTDFSRSNIAPVYKFTDGNGNVTYSSFVLDDFVEIEKVTIASPPSVEYANETRLRSEKLKAVAEELGKAREKREKLREEKEKKRQERLALINQSRLRFYERNGYAGYPYLFWGGYSHGGNYWPHYPVHLPAAPHNSAPLPSSSSSFLPGLH